MHHICLHSTGGDLVLWPHLAARETGRMACGLADQARAQPQLDNYVKGGSGHVAQLVGKLFHEL